MDSLNRLFLDDNIKDYIKKISCSEATVLITGESGVGKEIVAQTVHNLSSRKEKEPVVLNVAALPSDLLEKELFGSVKGSFTDSKEDSVGKFKQADGSTLILDEIGELSLNVQGKLLNAIENGLIQPLGSNKLIQVDCRIIAITNRDLNKLVEEGFFRKDLFYRLNVLNIHIPPLRERIKEFRLILNTLLTEYSSDNKVYTISKDGFSYLLKEEWPGNIRELKNRLERAIVMSDSNEISSDILLLSSDIKVNMSEVTLKEAVRLFKKKYITQALEIYEWNITKTSKFLDIQRTYLSRLIKELNIE